MGDPKDPRDLADIDLANRTYKITYDPLDGLVAFRLAMQAGVQPDPEVLDMLNRTISDWFKHEGKKSLDSLMGIGFKRLKTRGHKKTMGLMFYFLAMALKLGVEKHKAASAVCLKMHQIDRFYPGVIVLSNAGRRDNLGVITPDTLLEYYRKRRKVRVDAELSAEAEIGLWSVSDNPEALKREFIKSLLGN